MRKEFTIDDARAISLKEVQIAEQRRRLLNEPTFCISVNQATLRSLLEIGRKVFKRDFGEVTFDPDQKGKFFVTGEQFTSLKAMQIQITQARRHQKPTA